MFGLYIWFAFFTIVGLMTLPWWYIVLVLVLSYFAIKFDKKESREQ